MFRGRVTVSGRIMSSEVYDVVFWFQRIYLGHQQSGVQVVRLTSVA